MHPAPLEGTGGNSEERYARYSDAELHDWLALDTVQSNIVLTLTGEDLFDAHTALRHASSLDPQHHTILVVMSPVLRKHRGFTPWLKNAVSITPPSELDLRTGPIKSPIVLNITEAPAHTHDGNLLHHATFDMRVAGKMARALLDTGSTCNCVSKRFAEKCGMTWQPAEAGSVKGLGGLELLLWARPTQPSKWVTSLYTGILGATPHNRWV